MAIISIDDLKGEDSAALFSLTRPATTGAAGCARVAAEAALRWLEAEAAAAALAWRPAVSDRLTLVRGLDPVAAAVLDGVGISSFADIAALTAEDVDHIGRLMGDVRRISREGWIEQAAVLASGIDTAHVSRLFCPVHAAIEIAAPEAAFDAGAEALAAAARLAQVSADALRAAACGEAALSAAVAVATQAASAMRRAEVIVPAAATARPAAVIAAEAALGAEAARLAALPAVEIPAAVTAPVAEVVVLADRRRSQPARRRSSAMVLGRWAAVAASVALVAGVAIDAAGLATALMATADRLAVGCNDAGLCFATLALMAQ